MGGFGAGASAGVGAAIGDGEFCGQAIVGKAQLWITPAARTYSVRAGPLPLHNDGIRGAVDDFPGGIGGVTVQT